jgi:hypothetical protein
MMMVSFDLMKFECEERGEHDRIKVEREGARTGLVRSLVVFD